MIPPIDRPPFPPHIRAHDRASQIRNFSIVAHIDHGKSTLADRLIQSTGTVAERDMKEQMLDAMDIERERGITIKANTVRIEYPAQDGQTYILNLIDTPGHVDFAYEVSRSMRAVEGSLLVVDASQGVEAQTLANVYHAIDANHEIVPVLNKIDLPAAEPDRVKEQIEDVIGLDASDADPHLRQVRPRHPRRAGGDRAPPARAQGRAQRAAEGDAGRFVVRPYLGVVVLIRVMDGVIRKGDKIKMMQTGATYGVDTLAVLKPADGRPSRTGPGRDRHLHRLHQAGPRHPRRRHHHPRAQSPAPPAAGLQTLDPGGLLRPLPGRRQRIRGSARRHREARAQRRVFTYEMETSAALGFGFRCGFLGLLHLEVVRDRLEREYDIDLITTAPSVVYRIHMRDGTMRSCTTPPTCPT
jgi:GTP-binding protein LepA